MNQKRASLSVKFKSQKPKVTGDPDSIWATSSQSSQVEVRLSDRSYPLDAKNAIDLGEDFAAAVIQIEDGDPNVAYDRISPHVDKGPSLAERSERLCKQVKITDAASDLQSFGAHFEHGVIGNTHTGALWISLLARLGRVQEALQNAWNDLRKQNTSRT